jgi:hypothetical protein
VEREPRARTPKAAFLVVLVAPLAFLLLMVPELLAGGAVKIHPAEPRAAAPEGTAATPVANVPPQPFPAIPTPGQGGLGSNPAVEQPPPGSTIVTLAEMESRAPSTPGQTPAVTRTSGHDHGKHRGEGQLDSNKGS